MGDDVKQFTRNYDSYGSNKSWRTKRQGFLKPLPIPDRIWAKISIDFITDILELEGCTTIVVITDRFNKGVIAGELLKLIVEALIK
jgi:hydroxyacyl-ACP dehydratase HTD2-like protein with hotdog domain